MITTHKFSLTKKAYFKILLTIYLRKKWWLLAWILLMGLANVFGDYTSGTFFVVFAIVYPIAVLYRFWSHVSSKDNRIFFTERYIIITNTSLDSHLLDGSENKIMVTNFIKYIELKNTYILYLSKIQATYIPKNAFQSPSDEVWFQRNILYRIKK